MELPFTQEQFLGVFAAYNRRFALVAVAFWVATAGTLAFVSRNPARRSWMLSLFLGVLWLWNALVYHAFLFSRINPAAWLFAALFLLEALLFFRVAATKRGEYLSATGSMRAVGMASVAYGLAYPFLTQLVHRYPATPTFAVPCPTAILTIGLLLTVRNGVPVALAIIPALWGFVGGSAAILLAVPPDYVLLAAGAVLTLVVWRQRTRRTAHL